MHAHARGECQNAYPQDTLTPAHGYVNANARASLLGNLTPCEWQNTSSREMWAETVAFKIPSCKRKVIVYR